MSDLLITAKKWVYRFNAFTTTEIYQRVFYFGAVGLLSPFLHLPDAFGHVLRTFTKGESAL